MVGAPVLAARAALRCGAGLVRIAAPARLTSSIHAASLETMTLPLPDGEDGQLLASGAEQLLARLGTWDALVLGPGIGRFPDTDRFVLKLLGGWSRPMVVDADALAVLAEWGPDSWVPRARDLRAAGAPGGLVLTPHAGELARLTGEGVESLKQDPIATARLWAGRWGVTLVFKGAPSVVASPQGRVWVNPTGNSGLATGGSGDLLAGMIGAFLGQDLPGPDAAVLGCYVHGLAADLWAAKEERAQRSLLPTDVLETLPAALSWVEQGRRPPRWRWSSV
jgi:NAD(P)H-hydrate epimerase